MNPGFGNRPDDDSEDTWVKVTAALILGMGVILFGVLIWAVIVLVSWVTSL